METEKWISFREFFDPANYGKTYIVEKAISDNNTPGEAQEILESLLQYQLDTPKEYPIYSDFEINATLLNLPIEVNYSYWEGNHMLTDQIFVWMTNSSWIVIDKDRMSYSVDHWRDRYRTHVRLSKDFMISELGDEELNQMPYEWVENLYNIVEGDK